MYGMQIELSRIEYNISENYSASVDGVLEGGRNYRSCYNHYPAASGAFMVTLGQGLCTIDYLSYAIEYYSSSQVFEYHSLWSHKSMDDVECSNMYLLWDNK